MFFTIVYISFYSFLIIICLLIILFFSPLLGFIGFPQYYSPPMYLLWIQSSWVRQECGDLIHVLPYVDKYDEHLAQVSKNRVLSFFWFWFSKSCRNYLSSRTMSVRLSFLLLLLVWRLPTHFLVWDQFGTFQYFENDNVCSIVRIWRFLCCICDKTFFSISHFFGLLMKVSLKVQYIVFLLGECMLYCARNVLPWVFHCNRYIFFWRFPRSIFFPFIL